MKRVEFLFDYASPWSFLANELLDRKLPGAEISWRPIYLRALESFRDGFPFKHAKSAYSLRDLERCAAHEGVTIHPPATFPINGLYALRGALLAQKLGRFPLYHGAMFRAAWVERRELSTVESVAQIARELGLPEIAEGIEDPAIKAELRAKTQDAVQRGVFGVPVFLVGHELFWGHDRIDYVQRALA